MLQYSQQNGLSRECFCECCELSQSGLLTVFLSGSGVNGGLPLLGISWEILFSVNISNRTVGCWTIISSPGIDVCLPSPGLPKTSYNRVVIWPQCFHESVILFALLRFSKCLPLLQWPFDPSHCPASDGVKIMGRQPSRDPQNRLKSAEQVRIVKHVNIGKCEKIVRSSFLKNVSLMVRSRA